MSEISTGKLDWNIAKKDITFDGKKIDFPFSVNDLGESYKMYSVYDTPLFDKCCSRRVVRINEDGLEAISCMLFFDNIIADEYNDDVKCSSMANNCMIVFSCNIP